MHVSARLSEAVSGRRVVIDPGHGGLDPGAVGRSGLREKDLVLEISFDLRRMLSRAGVYVTMTRETDRDFGEDELRDSLLARKRRDLGYRVNLANHLQGGCLPVRPCQQHSRSTMVGSAGFLQPRPALCPGTGRQHCNQPLPRTSTPVIRLAKPADYRVLNDTVMPAVTIEVGFLSNPEEEALLSQPAYRRKVAEADLSRDGCTTSSSGPIKRNARCRP